MRFCLALAPLALLAACSSAPDQMVSAPKVTLEEKVRTGFASVEVVEVSLPAFAAKEQVAISAGEGVFQADSLWADDPTRAVTLALARNLKEITGVRVASEPWPFDGFAEAKVDVRVEELAVAGQSLLFSGQYFVADQRGDGRDHAHLFALSAPLPEMTAGAIAQARGVVVAALAREIAKNGL